MVAGFFAQSVNMLDYPSFTFKDDEGIYAGQAWAVLHLGRLTPYTYFYDHAPAGWLLSAAWMALTGGMQTFGGAIDSGRVFMLALHIAMIPLLFRLTRQLGGNAISAGLAAALFSLSPLAIFYQRMFLLDNIMLFWLLMSLCLLLDEKGRLSHVILSGVTFGLAFVTKETAIFSLPVMVLILWRQRRAHQGIFAIYSWIIPMVMVVSWYPFYAILKGELLGAGQSFNLLFGGNSSTGPAVSLVDALKWQSTRGGGGIFNLDNLFWQLVRKEWFPRDPFLLAGGAAAILFNLVRGLFKRAWLTPGLLGLLPLIYLGRGGIVFDYYILFLIPFLCLNLGLVLGQLLKYLPNRLPSGAALIVCGGLLVLYALTGSLAPLYTEHPDAAGRAALSWIKQNVPSQSYIITRDDLWTDLHEDGRGGPSFPNVHSHWKVASDPAVRDTIFKDDWQNVDYLIMSPGLIESFTTTNNKIALAALSHATLIKRWTALPGNIALHPQQFIELWKVNKPAKDSAPAQDSTRFANNLSQQITDIMAKAEQSLPVGGKKTETGTPWNNFTRSLGNLIKPGPSTAGSN